MSERSRQSIDRALIDRAKSGDTQAERALVEALSPIIRASVARTIRRFSSTDRMQDMEDVTQSVLLSLCAAGEGAFARWDPDRGLDLAGFVSMVAAHETVTMLRRRRRAEVPTAAETLDERPAAAVGPEAATGARRMIAAVAERVRGRVSERGGRIFDLFFLEQQAPEDISTLTGLGLPVIYTWTSRLSRLGREVAAELESEPTPSERAPLATLRRRPSLSPRAMEARAF